jgi:hypothetical protein
MYSLQAKDVLPDADERALAVLPVPVQEEHRLLAGVARQAVATDAR